MKIFISWSGDVSREVAEALKLWLPNVFQAMDPTDVFLSSSDIAVGTQWFHELGRVLEQSDFGVLCLTRQNLRAPWVLFEAGAIAKRLETARVVPLLIGLAKEEVPNPLSQLQGTALNRDGVEKLLRSINEQLGDDKLSEVKLHNAMQAWWPKLEPVLQIATENAHRAAATVYAHDVFLSAPMAAYSDDNAYVAARAKIKKVFDALTQDCSMHVYWAGERIPHIQDFDTIDVSVLDDLKALDQSKYFVLVYPEKLVTSALFEAGYAIAQKRVSHYFVRERDDLPFLMRELPGSVPSVRIYTKQDWKDYDDLARKLKRNQDHWFP